MDARRELLAVEGALRQGQLQPGSTAIQRAVDSASRSTRAARRLTSDGLWRLAARTPIAGCPLRSSAALTGAADELTRDIVQPLATLSAILNPRRDTNGFAVDVIALGRSSPAIAAMTARLGVLGSDVSATPGCSFGGSALGLPSAQEELAGRVQRLASAAADLQLAARLLPPMLGADSPRRYLLVVQNDAESRATGGVIGGYGYLTAFRGRLSLDTRNAGTLPSFGAGPVLRLSDELERRYGRLGLASEWGNANLTPDFPLAARMYSTMWSKGTGRQLDGVVAIDPVLLGYLLTVVGSATMPDGRMATGSTLVPLLQSQIYSLLPTNAQRDAYFAGAGKAIYSAVLKSSASPMRLLSALGRGADEGRLLVWSRRPAEQRGLETTPLAGALSTAHGPYLAVISQNATGSKLEYWLRRSTEYQLRRLPGGSGEAVVSVRLTNSAPVRGLPPYVYQRIEDTAPRSLIPGQTALYVSVYGGVGAGFTSATLDGKRVTLESEREKGHGVFSTFLSINPGHSRVLRVVISEPAWQPFVRVRRQPLISPERITVSGAQVRGAL